MTIEEQLKPISVHPDELQWFVDQMDSISGPLPFDFSMTLLSFDGGHTGGNGPSEKGRGEPVIPDPFGLGPIGAGGGGGGPRGGGPRGGGRRGPGGPTVGPKEAYPTNPDPTGVGVESLGEILREGIEEVVDGTADFVEAVGQRILGLEDFPPPDRSLGDTPSLFTGGSPDFRAAEVPTPPFFGFPPSDTSSFEERIRVEADIVAERMAVATLADSSEFTPEFGTELREALNLAKYADSPRSDLVSIPPLAAQLNPNRMREATRRPTTAEPPSRLDVPATEDRDLGFGYDSEEFYERVVEIVVSAKSAGASLGS